MVYGSDIVQQQLQIVFAVVRNTVHVYVQLVFCRYANHLDSTRDWFGTDEGLDIMMDVYKILGFQYSMSLSLDSLIAAQVFTLYYIHKLEMNTIVMGLLCDAYRWTE